MNGKSSGFTLIEIAIVLVIIGLLLGGVLKGQELINSAKVKNLASDFKNVPVFIYGYQDKFKALPGDDKAATTHLAASGVTITGGDGNGSIGGAWNGTSGEAYVFWQHVRLAGFAPGPTDLSAGDYIPRNAVGGPVGIQGGTSIPIANLRGAYFVCSGAIAGKFAKQLDISLDDSNTATGSMMAAASGATAATPNADISDEIPYTVCIGV